MPEIGFGGFVVPAIDSNNSAESVCDSSDVQMNSSLITPRNSLHTVVGSWADHERIKSSTWRELEAVNRTVKSSLHLLKNQTLQINTDNKNVTSIVKNGSRKTDLQVLACELHTLCFENSCEITTQWIPRDQNKVADNLSRYSDCDDWGISTEVFNSLDKYMGLNIEQVVHEAVEDSGIEEGHSLHNLVESLSTRLLDARSENNGGTFSTVNTAFYSVKWAHEIYGQLDPTSNTFVQNLLESAKRTAKNPVNKKDPVSKDILIDLCSKYQYSNDLTVVRDLVMILLSFSAFLRFSELSQLKCNDVTIKEGYLVLKIRKSKTDQYRAGDEVLVSKGQSLACPYSMFLRYLGLANIEISTDMYLFRPLYRSKDKCGLIKVNRPISYTTA
ncbi:Hypothetical predicted protein [Mytilus galloprovincialis]|uniref:RNase H type-1 domain-containing protein n=1 Tax=Mytilus galloprovincialis TaxID=29158 RepID=A0A8B6H0R8_MYTGA|nr:Hypothetical predicted protein [Mytilus galloprovincialis]